MRTYLLIHRISHSLYIAGSAGIAFSAAALLAALWLVGGPRAGLLLELFGHSFTVSLVGVLAASALEIWLVVTQTPGPRAMRRGELRERDVDASRLEAAFERPPETA